jgi:hypothetical protein
MFFQVKNPQLEYEPGQFREGIKRYGFNKNMNSYEFPSIPRPLVVNDSQPQHVNPGQSASSEVLKLKQQLLMRQQEIDRLRSLTEGPKSLNSSPQGKSYQEPLPKRNEDRNSRSSYDYNIFEISRHPAFQQPKFTKRNPKVVSTNPLNSFSDRSLGHYGNMIVTRRPGS